jgi:hypothetical protein
MQVGLATEAERVICPSSALALLGWYLMIPPLQSANRDDPSGPRDLHAPISQWDQVSAYDSAAKCQRDIGKYFFFPKPDGTTKQANALKIGGRCISTDDPRLAK